MPIMKRPFASPGNGLATECSEMTVAIPPNSDRICCAAAK